MAIEAQRYSLLSSYERRLLRLKYITVQNNLCYWCNTSLDDAPPKSILDLKINWSLFPAGFLNYPIHLQHNHDTDLTEGAVHAYCNAVMWQYHKR